MTKNDLIFAFDLGTGSIGECVRAGSEIKHLESLLLPPDFAATEKQALRRRQMRTRESHRARENWWREQAKIAGLEILESRQPVKENGQIKNYSPDRRMLREFPEAGDTTIYTSSLLRIALLQGIKLESWQVYKAIWSAIQHRGYDTDVPWIKEHRRNISKEENTEEKNDPDEKKKNDEAENGKAVEEYTKLLNNCFGDKKEFHYPCYLEAYRMGIWNPTLPNKLDGRIGSNPSPARNKGAAKTAVAPRELVEKELRTMLEQAARQYLKLKGKIDLILYGSAEKPYVSHSKVEGVLGQKVPRFNNRIISKCCLIPRLNVCNADDELNRDITFLMKLKNMRYFYGGNKECALDPKQLAELFEKYKETKSVTPKRWGNWVKEKLGGIPNPTQLEVEKPKISGRSRFCRPALKILKEILLHGTSPHEKHKELVKNNKNTSPNKGLVTADYAFLLDMPADWYNFTIPDHRSKDEKLDPALRPAKIDEVINEVNNPVIRHRLRLFERRLQSLKNKFGAPDKLVLELVRDSDEGFMGAKRKKMYDNLQKDNRKKKDDAFKDLREANIAGRDSLLKMMLYREQNGLDFYSLQPIEVSHLNNYEIDHIVPRENGGSDAYINKILTTHENNQNKSNRTPFEWLSGTEQWLGILEKVKKSKLHPKKKALLTAENAKDLINKYTQLASTAYIAKLAQRVASLFFGWPQQTEGSKRKIIVTAGGHTAKIRRRYGLDRLLHTGKTDEEFKKLIDSGEIDKKNRDNPRHHALDALVISCIPEMKYNSGTGNDEMPKWFHKDFCKDGLEKVNPVPVNFLKPKLAETIYGLRKIQRDGQEFYCAITRFGTGTKIEDFSSLKNAQKYTESIFDSKIREDFQAKLGKKPTETEWQGFLKNYHSGGKPKKIAQIASGKIAPDGIDNSLGIAANFKAMGKIRGQYYSDKKEHQGQLVYLNEKKKWIVEPVYVYDSLYVKMTQVRKKSSQVHFFRSQQQVEIQKDCNMHNPKQQIPKGIYILKTIMGGAQGKLSTPDTSKELVATINTLMNEGQMRAVTNHF